MKYIVYKTTNLVNNYIYIGVHKTENPDIFDGYIGCGIKINKPATYENPKTNFQIAVKQFGVKNFKRETLATFDSEEEAYQLEELIVNENFLSRNDVYNMVLGGINGKSISIKCYQYDLNGNYLRTFDSLTEASIFVNKTISGISNSIMFKTSCGNYYWNTDKLSKLDLTNYNQVKKIKVYRYLINTGIFDKEFDSLSEAASQSNLTLVQVARSARLCYRAGDYQFLFIKNNSYDKAKSEYLRTRKVSKYSNDGTFICEYETQELAEKANKGSNISASVKNKKCCKNGFKWGLEKLPYYCSTKSLKKKVGQYDLNGNLISTFESVKECCDKTGVPRAYVTVGKKFKDWYFKGI